jgi:tetratricopeptide (TPR) repeat protein
VCFLQKMRVCRLTLSPAIPILLGACAAAPFDIVTCKGNSAAIKEAVVTQAYVLMLSNCVGHEPTQQQVAACTRAIDSNQLSDYDLVLALGCRGNKRLAEGDLDGAVADYSRAIRLEPYDSDLYSDRGAALVLKNQATLAIENFNQAIALQAKFMDRGHVFLYANRAAAWLALGEYDKAIADADLVQGHEVRLSSAFANRGLAWSLKGDHSRALDDFDSAVQHAPIKAQVYGSNLYVSKLYLLKGNTRAKSGDVDMAISDYSEAIRLNPRLAIAYIKRANLWRAKGDVDRAAADQEAAVRIDPRLKGWQADNRESKP